MKTWSYSIPPQHHLRLLLNIIIIGFMALVSIHFTLHKLTTNRDIASGQTRIQINLIHHLSEKIKGAQTLYFIWPTITAPAQSEQIHTELNLHIDQIFQSIRLLEYGGSIPAAIIPPDLANKNNADKFKTLISGQQFDPGTIKELKTNLQALFGNIEYLNRLLQSEDKKNDAILSIQQADSALFSALYGLTQGLISNTKEFLAQQQVKITKKQDSYKTLEFVLIIITLCTVCFLTWWATRQLISSSNILENSNANIENESQRHKALNSILMISMQKSPLEKQLYKSLAILLEVMAENKSEPTGAIFLTDSKNQNITATIRIGIPDELTCYTSFQDFSTCLCGTSLHSGEVIQQNKDLCPKCVRDKNFYCTPIGPTNTPIGVLMLGFPESKPSLEKMAFLKFVTPILAGIILKSQYEQQLGKSELATLSIFQESQQAILLLRDNEIIDWNNGAASLFKANNLQTFSATHDLQKLLGKSAITENPFKQHIKTALSEGVSHGELRLRKQNGAFFLASLTFTTIPLHGEHIIYLVIHDISTREAEKKALIQARDDAEKASLAKSTFLTTMSHEILTPLNAILGITALTMNLELSAETRENLEIIHTSSQSLRALVMDILDISKIEADQFTTNSIVFSIRAIARDLQHLFESEAQNHEIIFTVNIDNNSPDNLLGDPSRLKQVLEKLIANGFKYTRQGTINLTISCKKKSTTACCLLFTVQDTGIGIDQTNLKTVFNGFTQITDSDATRYNGAGLGLTISKRIVEKMGGTIWATSGVNQGSAFYIEMSFPLHTSLSPKETPNQPKRLVTHLTGKKILVVEDSPINLKVTCQTLKGMGVDVFEAINGEDGVAAMRPELDAVLMDVEMPILDGIQATKIIRKDSQYDHIPIIAITAHGINEDKKHCFHAGMNDYMTKPLEPEVLLQVLTRNINEAQSKPMGPIDYSAGIEKVGGDHTFFNEILQDFCELHGSEGKLLAELFSQEEFAEIQERAHRLKGVAGTISAHEFASKAKLLEEQTRASTINTIEVEKTIFQVQQCIADVLNAINSPRHERIS